MSRRQSEAAEIRVADKAAATGRLLLGEFTRLADFIKVGEREYATLPRRSLRTGRADVRSRLSAEVQRFCQKNFEGVTMAVLARLYDDLAPVLQTQPSVAIPIPEFEQRYGAFTKRALHGIPRYATTEISLRGLQFRCPEDQLAKDTIAALDIAKFYGRADNFSTQELSAYDRHIYGQRLFAARASVSSAFNLVEAYLNGLLWEHRERLQPLHVTGKAAAMIADPTSATLTFKLRNLPQLVTGNPLPAAPAVERLLGDAKAFRDSLTHASPFTAPERFGGYSKLLMFHAVDIETALAVARDAVSVLDLLQSHVSRAEPRWFAKLREAIASETPTAQFQDWVRARSSSPDNSAEQANKRCS